MRLPGRPPSLGEIATAIGLDGAALQRIMAAVRSPEVNGKYLPWEDARHFARQYGLSQKELWLGLKLQRGALGRRLPLLGTDGTIASYGLTDAALETLHWIDQHSPGELLVSDIVSDPAQRRQYAVSTLIEESITSSQLEGAAVTRKVAKEMLTTGRSPRDRDERMILNNYRAMTRIRELASHPLNLDVILELHRVLTDGTLDDPNAAGRIQRPDEIRVKVFDPQGQPVHVPPPAEALPERLAAMVDFANGVTPGTFVHPVVRAILLHFWLAYDHPFEDGNGRTARALFYWAMLHGDYFMFEYLSISRLLLKAPMQYARAFLHTEADGLDTTYFLVYQLDIIRRAVEDLMAFLERKVQEVRSTVDLLRYTPLNHRQAALIRHAIRHPDAVYTVRRHATSHDVVPQSARTDLRELVEYGLLTSRRIGRADTFFQVGDLPARLQALSAPPNDAPPVAPRAEPQPDRGRRAT